jgi:olefin beta-lactone synthetase
VTSAGAPVPAQVVARMRELLPEGARFWTPYGATECLPVSVIEGRRAGAIARAHRNRRGNLRRPAGAPNVVRIIRIDDGPIDRWSDALLADPGQVGEITVAGPDRDRCLLRSRPGDPLAKITETLQEPDDATGAGASTRIVHRMGDLGYFDAEGRLWFCGRKSQRVVTAQATLCTEQVEPVFNLHPEVARTALVGIGERGAQRPVLCVELEPGVANGEQARIAGELRHLAEGHVHTAAVETFLFHPGFPVDIRHNAKIGREKLAHWARRQPGWGGRT